MIAADLEQAYSYFGSKGRLKHVKQMRPNMIIEGTAELLAAVSVDYETTPDVASISLAPQTAGIWDTALWDAGLWGGLELSQPWLMVEAIGTACSPRFKTTTASDTRLQSTDYVFEFGGIIG